MKTFTLEEAQSLLPVLESLLKRALESKQAAEKVEADLSALSQRIYVSGGMYVNVGAVAKQRAEVEDHTQRMRESIAKAESSDTSAMTADSPGLRTKTVSLVA